MTKNPHSESNSYSSAEGALPATNNLLEKEAETTSERHRKKILITGCSSGIGKASALHFQKLGWEVVATVRKAEDGLDLEEAGCIVKICDLNKEAEVEALFADADLEYFDHAYLNAGYGFVAAVEDCDRQTLKEQFETNVFGTWQCFTKVIAKFRELGRGRCIVCSSVVGFVAAPYRGAYAASKHALEAMVATARIEINNPQIQISCINPGPVKTNFRPTCIKVYNESTRPLKEKSHHGDAYEHQEKRLASPSTSKMAVSPEDVAQKLEKIFQARRQKQNYLICIPTHFAYYLKKLLPAGLWEKILAKTYILEK